MKFFALLITNNVTTYGGAQPRRRVVLLVCIPTQTDNYDANGYVTSVTYNGHTYTYTYDGVGRLANTQSLEILSSILIEVQE